MNLVPLFVTILLTAMLSLGLFAAFTATSGAKTIIVDDDWNGADYNNISAAVAAAENGDEIIVNNGTYREQVRVQIPISILGNGSQSTFLIGTGNTTDNRKHILMGIDRSNVEVRGINFSWMNSSGHLYGIFILSDQTEVSDCVFTNLKRGIVSSPRYYSPLTRPVNITRCTFIDCSLDMEYTHNGTIDRNRFLGSSELMVGRYGLTISNNEFIGLANDQLSDTAIDLSNSRNCKIIANYFIYKEIGIELMATSLITVEDNEFLGCRIGIKTSSYNKYLNITNNSFKYNDMAISISSESEPIEISDNEFVDNTVDIVYRVEHGGSEYNWSIVHYVGVAIIIIWIISVLVVKRRKGRRPIKPSFRPQYRSRRP